MGRVRTLRVAAFAGPLCVAALSIAGCGGSVSNGKFIDHPALPASSFPSPNGRSFDKVLQQASGPGNFVLTPTTTVLYKSKTRYSFGVFSHGSLKPVPDAQMALYIAKSPPAGALPNPKANGAPASKNPLNSSSSSLNNPAYGPFPVRIESLQTKPAFRARSTADDPSAARVVYTTNISFPSNGDWRVGALIKKGDKYDARLLTSAEVGKFHDIPRVGQRAPNIHTPTEASVGGDLSKLTTRVPPEHMNTVDFHDVLGKKPIVLLFATPKFCQSRVSGSAVDEAAQVQSTYGNRVEFIHMEIFKNNNPSEGVRPQVRAFNLPSEPWLFVIDHNGIIRTAIEGAFNVKELNQAVKAVAGG